MWTDLMAAKAVNLSAVSDNLTGLAHCLYLLASNRSGDANPAAVHRTRDEARHFIGKLRIAVPEDEVANLECDPQARRYLEEVSHAIECLWFLEGFRKSDTEEHGYPDEFESLADYSRMLNKWAELLRKSERRQQASGEMPIPTSSNYNSGPGAASAEKAIPKPPKAATPPPPPAPTKRPGEKGPRVTRDSAELTSWELKLLRTYADCKGNAAEVARRLGKNRESVERALEQACEKSPEILLRPTESPTPTRKRTKRKSSTPPKKSTPKPSEHETKDDSDE